MAGRRTPPPPRSDDGDGESDDFDPREAFESLTERVDELFEAVTRRERARTSSGRRSAAQEVREQESALRRELRNAGFGEFTEDDLHDLRASRRQSELDDWWDRKRQEMLEDLAAEADQAGYSDGGDTGRGRSRSRSRSKTAAAKGDGDTGDGDAGGDGDTGGDADRGRRGYFS